MITRQENLLSAAVRKASLVLLPVAVTMSAALALFESPAEAFNLNNGSGNGTLQVGVDGFGSFGLAVGGVGTTNAFFDPVGPAGLTDTTFQSGVAIGFGSTRTFLTSGQISGSGGLINPTITGTPTSANSSFSFGGLNFNLIQTLAPLFNSGTQTGSLLTQKYTISNTTSNSVSFDLVRYLDADLRFDGTLVDGGGRLNYFGTEILFETDSANNGPANANTFVAITGESDTIPTSNRYQINVYDLLAPAIVSGNPLNNTILNDGNGDQFIDNGSEYDVTLALRNEFSLGGGGTTSYTTKTIFGSGIAPAEVLGSSQDFVILPDIIEPGRFVFVDVPSGRWFDPPLASGFDYSMLSDSLFTEIVNFPTGFSDPFTVSVGDKILGQFNPGQSVDFVSLLGQGVPKFTISGINPPVDSADPTAFPLQLAFNTPTASFEMRARPVPEASSALGLLAFGAFGAGSLLKRKKHLQQVKDKSCN